MKKTTVYLPEELDLLLEQAARREGASKAELIRVSVSRYLEQTGAGRVLPRSLGAIDEDLGVTSSAAKQWLREHLPEALEK